MDIWELFYNYFTCWLFSASPLLDFFDNYFLIVCLIITFWLFVKYPELFIDYRSSLFFVPSWVVSLVWNIWVSVAKGVFKIPTISCKIQPEFHLQPLFFTQPSHAPFWDIYIHKKKTKPTPKHPFSWPGLESWAKRTTIWAKWDPNWAICLKSGQNFLEVGKKNLFIELLHFL